MEKVVEAKVAGRSPSLLRIIEMNVGFFGLQLAFGLQIANSSPIFRTLGASGALLPLLWIAGPVTGLIVQPFVGVISDRTRTLLGRRTPYMLTGAALSTLGLLAMPYSSALWIAASLLWLLDAANNMTLEPYRAYVADNLPPERRAGGYLVQSAFTGLSQTLSYALPSLIALFVDAQARDANGLPAIVRIAFVTGAIILASSVVYSLWRMPEGSSLDVPIDKGRPPAWRELAHALRDMPAPMRMLALPMLCQWYAMFAYWQFIVDAIAQTLHGTRDALSPGYNAAILTAQQMGMVYNAVAFVVALALIPLVRRTGTRNAHAGCLAASGLAMLAIPQASSLTILLFLATGIGIGWAGLMGNTYAMLAETIPPGRNGVYMGIFNMFIVIPMFIESATMPFVYEMLLGAEPAYVVALAGIVMLAGAASTLFLDLGKPLLNKR